MEVGISGAVASLDGWTTRHSATWPHSIISATEFAASAVGSSVVVVGAISDVDRAGACEGDVEVEATVVGAVNEFGGLVEFTSSEDWQADTTMVDRRTINRRIHEDIEPDFCRGTR
jgi:hypothetical protein